MTVRLAIVGFSLSLVEALKELHNHSDKKCSVVGITVFPRFIEYPLPFQKYENFSQMMQQASPDAVIMCRGHEGYSITPMVKYCAEKGIGLFFEEQRITTKAEVQKLINITDTYQIPILIGKPRLFSAQLQHAKELLSFAKIGTLVRGTVLWTMRQDHDYFDTKIPQNFALHQKGRGKCNIELLRILEEIDSLRYLFGDITQIRTIGKESIPGAIFTKSNSLSLYFSSGFILDIFIAQALPPTLLQAISKPKETGARPYKDDCLTVFGSQGSVHFPSFKTTLYDKDVIVFAKAPHLNPVQDAYSNLLLHFCEVIQGLTKPRNSLKDELRTLDIHEKIIDHSKNNGLGQKTISQLLQVHSPLYSNNQLQVEPTNGLSAMSKL